MDKKKLEYFKKRLESRQLDLRRMVTRTEQDGRTRFASLKHCFSGIET